MISYSHRVSRDELVRLGLAAASPPVPGRPNPEPDLPGPTPADEGEMPDEDADESALGDWVSQAFSARDSLRSVRTWSWLRFTPSYWRSTMLRTWGGSASSSALR